MEGDKVMLNLRMRLVKAMGVRNFQSAKGRRRGTWMNAVAMMTPVPKCFTEKNTHVGIRSFLTRFATIGKSAPYPKSVFGGKGASTKSGTEEDGKQAKEM
jgi:hypothetical protein